jgi:hypothetical protein
MKKFIISVVAATTVMFSLAGLFNGVLAREFLVSNVDQTLLRAPANLILVAAGYFVLSLLMALLYPRLLRAGGSPAINGLLFGMGAGVCWLMPYSLVLFGVYKFPYIALPLDFAWALVEQGIGGLVIGLVYGKLNKGELLSFS